MEPKLLEVCNLTVRKGGFSLRHINISLEPGDYQVILGPTGSGKTVLLETVAGHHTVQDGSIALQGVSVTKLPPESRNIGFAYQDSLLYPFLTVKENILFGVKARRFFPDPRITRYMMQLVDIMGIHHLLERMPRHLSGGERQRVSLARALLTQPPLLLLDEPLSALDPQTKQIVKSLLKDIHRTQPIAIMHVSHDFTEAIELGKSAVLINHGSIVQAGTPLDLFERPLTEFAARFMRVENMIPGKLALENGRFLFENDELGLRVGPLPFDHRMRTPACYLLIRAGQIKVSRHKRGEGTLCWPALVDEASMLGDHAEVVCHGHVKWLARMSPTELRTLNITRGDRVYLSVDPQQLHLVPRVE